MRVRIARHHNGIGDWLMCLAALRWLRAQHDDVGLVVDFRNAPRLVQDAFAASDLLYEDAREPHARTDLAVDHLVYEVRSSEPYLDGLARALTEATGRHVRPDRNDLPFRDCRRAPSARALCMVAHGKGVTRGGKEWGRENFAQLAGLLDRFDVQQVGGPRDALLPGAVDRRGVSFAALAATLLGARGFIGLENGLMVLAGFLRVPQVTIYDGAPGAQRVDFDLHLKIADRVSPTDVFARIQPWLA